VRRHFVVSHDPLRTEQRKFFSAMLRCAVIGLTDRTDRLNLSGMSGTDNTDFLVRFGRVRDRGARATHRARSFVAQALRAAAKANAGR
jgi:hypothetical protein